ncbi:MAG: hypothetical protein HY728_09865 [Candidatus Rokubacteria bacterium]|nr:hypothetical protein [Candidatus Rokubacteria bacterium]
MVRANPERRRRPLPPPEPPLAPAELEPDLPLSAPEPAFAARTPPPAPERPLPAARRAIFFDVENTSRAEHIARTIDHLAIDRLGRRTEFVAVGNWRVIGSETARLLARHGAQLVHSAPSTGVRDWSDLRIAVSAGVWLGAARPGDILEIVSDDRAFDAVGDVAATLGIAFRRLSYRSLSGAPAGEVAVDEAPVESGSGRGRRGRRRGRGRGEARPAQHAPAVERHRHEPARPAAAAAEPHTAPHDEIVDVVRDLMRGNAGQAVLIDTLANALKSRGFRRPPGSPRLITRLRRIKELAVAQNGMISLIADAPPDGGELDTLELVAAPAPGGEPGPDGALAANAPRRRRSRRGGRRHRRRGPGQTGGDSGA